MIFVIRADGSTHTVPYPQEEESVLKTLQGLVGGLIEPVRLFEDRNLLLLCNEEGRLLDLPRISCYRDFAVI